MSMTVGGSKRQIADINVTPMIDVLLVLLIIFMVVTPIKSRGLHALVPQPASGPTGDVVRDEDVVISVERDGFLRVNQEPVTVNELPGRLRRIFETRGNTVIFVRADKELNFRSVAEVIDIAKGAGLSRIALATSL